MITVSGFDPTEKGLDGLLELDRQTIEVGDGYWVAMRAKRVPRSKHRPHGIQYALTLHRPGGKRILGYDNAHTVPMRTSPSRRSRQPVEYDHIHRGNRTHHYVFGSAGKLLEDFWADVEVALEMERTR